MVRLAPRCRLPPCPIAVLFAPMATWSIWKGAMQRRVLLCILSRGCWWGCSRLRLPFQHCKYFIHVKADSRSTQPNAGNAPILAVPQHRAMTHAEYFPQFLRRYQSFRCFCVHQCLTVFSVAVRCSAWWCVVPRCSALWWFVLLILHPRTWRALCLDR